MRGVRDAEFDSNLESTMYEKMEAGGDGKIGQCMMSMRKTQICTSESVTQSNFNIKNSTKPARPFLENKTVHLFLGAHARAYGDWS